MPRVTANGVELYYEEVGEGTPLVLQAHHHMPWMPFQVSYFSQFYRVITFDRRGTGRSSVPDGEWTNADFAADLKGLLDVLEVEKAIVGGASLGGVIACQFGLDYPDRALALVIGHTVPWFDADSQAWVDEQIEIIESGGRPIVMQPKSFPWEDSGPPTQRPGFAESEIGQFLATLQGGVGKTPDAAIRMLRAIREWDVRPRAAELARLAMPVLVLAGGNEPQQTVTLSYEWHKMIPGSDFYILRNAHHGAHREDPVGWNRVVHGFLTRSGV
jgi:pimeloyl-ACP methyl ester carboxylesterase